MLLRYLAIILVLLLSAISYGENILLTRKNGVYYIPGVLNDKVRLEFTVDTGASLVFIPNYVFDELKKKGTISRSDIIGRGKSQIANGDIVDIVIINLKKLRIGHTEIENIRAGVGGDRSSILLGQSALKKLAPWHLDTKNGILQITSEYIPETVYVSSGKGIGRTEALDFIQHYISLQNSRNPAAITSLYAPKVNYMNRGIVNSSVVYSDKEIFFRKWQKISLNFIELKEFKKQKNRPGLLTVKFSTAYDLYNDFEHRGKSGQALYTLVLEKSNGSIKIVSEKVKTLSESNF